MRVLLISNSTQHGGAYLEHCAVEVQDFFAAASCRQILFVPYALKDHDAYAATAAAAFERMGFELSSMHTADLPRAAVEETDGIFIGGGNTFRLLKTICELGVIEPIRSRVTDGMPYMGTSAGSNIACLSIRTTNDMPIVEPPTFEALGLVPFQLNPHYVDPDSSSVHMGETRETRIREFHEENGEPVLGLREGGKLRIEGDAMTLVGSGRLRLFRRGEQPAEYDPGADLSFLLG